MQFETVRVAKFFDEALIGIGFFAAQLVIYMGDREHDAEFVPQLKQQEQKCHRVGTPGNGDGDAVSGHDQALFSDCSKQTREHFHGEMLQVPSTK